MSTETTRPYAILFNQYTKKTSTPWAVFDENFKEAQPELYDKILAGYKADKPYEENGYTYKMSVRVEYDTPTVFQNRTPTNKANSNPIQTILAAHPSKEGINMSEEFAKINAKLDGLVSAMRVLLKLNGINPDQ